MNENTSDLPTGEWGLTAFDGEKFPARVTNTWAAGVDLGKTIDPSTVVILRKERRPVPVLPGDPNHALDIHLRQKLGPPKIFTEFAGRIPLGTDWMVQARMLKELSMRQPYRDVCKDWVVDASGVGGGMVDKLSEVGLRCIRVVISSGRNPSQDPDGKLVVPKLELMAALMGSFAGHEIQISPKLPDYPEIMGQLRAMQAAFSASGQMTFNGASGTHDDYCTAFALALYRLNPVLTGNRYSMSSLGDLIYGAV